MAEAKRSASARAVPKERANFKALLAKNPNYFGNLEATELMPAPKAVKKIASDTSFEQLTCLGFNPQKSYLEATIAVKRPTGYGGDLCQAGSTEYIRFFLDYGSGWEDAGLTGVRVHDIPNANDCKGKPKKPLTYAASLRIDPRRDCCAHPVLPRVRAILSWQWIPPAGDANADWEPVWGNVLEDEIQIEPRPWSIFCLLETVGATIGKKIKIPPLFEQTKFHPIPLPDPPPFALAELAELYGAGKEGGRRTAAAKKAAVEPHRFGLTELHALSAPAGGFDSETFAAGIEEWKAIGLDIQQALAALEDTKADVSYEELECLSLDDTSPERLVATFRVKRPSGYSGDLCHAGSKEYVAFWADWDDTCEWTYLGTAGVDVHDIAEIPSQGLCYSAILPVDLMHHRRSCKEPKVGRVRAVMSWAVPPSTTDPDALMTWGNRLDSHVQIAPGPEIPPGEVEAKIRNLGGIAVEDIDTTGTGLTHAADVRFAHSPASTADGWGLQRACPFGGTILVEGNFFPGYYYRVKVRKAGDPPSSFTALGSSFLLERADTGYDLQTSVGGFFKYGNPWEYFTRILAEWHSPGEDGVWKIQLDVATAPNEASILASSPWHAIQVDNTGPIGPPAAPPTMDIHITEGGDCHDFAAGTTIEGNFVADDAYFGGWSLSTEPNTLATPSNPPQPTPALANTSAAPGPVGHGWKLDTASPTKMKPCGYVVRLEVWDRSIRNSYPGAHNGNAIAVGLCLRAK